MELTDSQEQKLRQMLGADPGRYKKKDWGFRNHYAVGTCNIPHLAELRVMEKVGLVVEGYKDEDLIFFHATEAGCRAVGLKGKRIKEALGK